MSSGSWRFELVGKPYGGISEGPVWDGESILFTHIGTSSIMRYSPDSGQISEWRGGTNHTNGLAWDSAGRLFGACSGGRSILRFDPDGGVFQAELAAQVGCGTSRRIPGGGLPQLCLGHGS